MSTLLLDSQPLVVLPELACAIGLNEAIVVQQIHYWTERNKRSHTNFRDGHYWTYNTYAGWVKQFPWWSEHTIRRILKGLESSGIIVTGKYNNAGFDQTKWYRLDYGMVAEKVPSVQNGQMEAAKMDRPIPETTTETIDNGNNGRMVSADKSAPTVTADELDADISSFIKWYFDYYQSMTGKPHPPIKSHQRLRVHGVLKDFCLEYYIESDGLEAMAEAFFCVAASDHNINHFATPGILVNRFYEELY